MIERYTHRGKPGTLIQVRVQPRSSREGPLSVFGDPPTALRWGVRAAPVDGQANADLLKSLSAYFSIRKSSFQLLRGEQSRHKAVFIEGIAADEVRSRLNSL